MHLFHARGYITLWYGRGYVTGLRRFLAWQLKYAGTSLKIAGTFSVKIAQAATSDTV